MCIRDRAIYNAIKYDNVHPVIMCGDAEARAIIKKAIEGVGEILPSTEKITVHLNYLLNSPIPLSIYLISY